MVLRWSGPAATKLSIYLLELSMRILKRLLLTASMCSLVATANAEPMDDADAARQRVDYAQALKILLPLAAQGLATTRSDSIGTMAITAASIRLTACVPWASDCSRSPV